MARPREPATGLRSARGTLLTCDEIRETGTHRLTLEPAGLTHLDPVHQQIVVDAVVLNRRLPKRRWRVARCNHDLGSPLASSENVTVPTREGQDAKDYRRRELVAHGKDVD